MKQRTISAVVGIALLILVLVLYDTQVVPVMLALLSGLAVYEVLVPTRFLFSRTVGMLCAIFAGLSIFLLKSQPTIYFCSLVFFCCGLICYAIVSRQQFTFRQLCLCVFADMAIPLAFSTVMGMHGWIYLLLTCTGAWITDMGAFFVGKAFGKRKLAPHISPNKTIEGAVGGIVASEIAFTLICYAYSCFSREAVTVSLFYASIIGFACAIVGIIGDLFASLIKREAGIKDYGNMIPGHGGILDRFDSFLFVAPTLYYLTAYLPLFS